VGQHGSPGCRCRHVAGDRDQGKADWVAATDNGVTALGVYIADDSAPLPGSAAANVFGHLSTTLGAYPATSLYALDSGANNLQALLAAAG
jgi:hypothetical protein